MTLQLGNVLKKALKDGSKRNLLSEESPQLQHYAFHVSNKPRSLTSILLILDH